jgi:hypothetical protein
MNLRVGFDIGESWQLVTAFEKYEKLEQEEEKT